MSAICGCIVLNKEKNNKQRLAELRDAFVLYYQKYAIDRHEVKDFDDGFMYCGVQFFNKEARNEILPIIDEKNAMYFTADCVLDNRDDIMLELGISDNEMPDGSIIFEANRRWGDEAIKKLQGVFSYVFFDAKSRKIRLCTDHFASRCLFYTIRDGVLVFSTLLYPMLFAIDKIGIKYQLNEKWLVDAISVRGPAIITDDYVETAVEEVFKVDAGRYVCVELNGQASYISYYDPVNSVKVDRKMTDEKCRRLLHEILSKSIKNCIRTDGEVGIKLSAGLDSSSIAGFAAPMLNEQKKKLYSFTSVPIQESINQHNNYYVDDESDGVLLQVKRNSNIVPEFVRCEGNNILDSFDEILHIWELPCKSEQNAVWGNEIGKLARSKGCRVMLSGATGNCTISAGDLFDISYTYLKQFRLLKVVITLSNYAKKYNYSRKKVVKAFFKTFINDKFRSVRNGELSVYDNIITKEEVGERNALSERFLGKIIGYSAFKTFKKLRQQIYLKAAYAQIGEIDTKLSLTYGYLERDPLKTDSFIEFVLSLPQIYFSNDQYSRRLVREFLDDVVPEEIRNDVGHRGRQSADNEYRLKMVWDQYEKNIIKTLHSEIALSFFDEEKIDDLLRKVNKDSIISNEMDARMLVDAYGFVKYIEQIEQKLLHF